MRAYSSAVPNISTMRVTVGRRMRGWVKVVSAFDIVEDASNLVFFFLASDKLHVCLAVERDADKQRFHVDFSRTCLRTILSADFWHLILSERHERQLVVALCNLWQPCSAPRESRLAVNVDAHYSPPRTLLHDSDVVVNPDEKRSLKRRRNNWHSITFNVFPRGQHLKEGESPLLLLHYLWH